MAQFWPVYDRSLNMDSLTRTSLLIQEYFLPSMPLFDKAGITHALAIDTARVQRWLARFDANAASIRAVHRRFAHNYHSSLAAFEKTIPDLDMAASPVFVLPSLLAFDARVDLDGEQSPLFFAPDGIVHYHGPDADLSVLFSHELFHCYQNQVNPALGRQESPPVYAALWSEGGATYASEIMNPAATPLSILLDDKILLRDGPGMVRHVATALLASLDATDEQTVNSFFTTNTQEAWPARAGYLVGLLCARQLCRTRSLMEFVRIDPPTLRALLAGALAQLAGR